MICVNFRLVHLIKHRFRNLQSPFCFCHSHQQGSGWICSINIGPGVPVMGQSLHLIPDKYVM